MNILHTVEFYYPSTGGAQEVVRQLSERMVQKGHNVTVATTKLPGRKSLEYNGVKIVEFEVAGNSVVGIKGEATRYKQFLINSDFDIMMNYAAQQWATDLAFDVLDKIRAKKILVPCGYSALRSPAFKDYFKMLPQSLRKYDGTIYPSGEYQDIGFARKHGIKNLHIIPNGADENEFSTHPKARRFRKRLGIKHFFILNIGNHTGAKGHKEALEVFRRFPFPATLLIIGHDVEGGCHNDCVETAKMINDKQVWFGKRVRLLSLDRRDTVAALQNANIFLFPSNIEASPIVLFEAVAAGLPFISSRVGNATEIARWTGGGIIAQTIAIPGRKGDVQIEIAPTVRQLVKLRLNPIGRRRMSRQGHENWLKKFTWEKITEQYLELYNEVTK